MSLVLFLPFIPFDTLPRFPGGREPSRSRKTGQKNRTGRELRSPGVIWAQQSPNGAGKRAQGAKSVSVLLPERLAVFRERPRCTFGTRVVELLQSHIHAQSSSQGGTPESVTPSAGGFRSSAVFLRASFVLFSCPEYGNTVRDTCQPPMDILMDLSSTAGFPFSAAPGAGIPAGERAAPALRPVPFFARLGRIAGKSKNFSPQKFTIYSFFFQRDMVY